MIVNYVNLTATKKKGKWKVSTAIYNITEYIASLSWGGSKDEVARKVEISMLNPITDPHVKKITLKLGSMLYVYDDNEEEIFRGYIVDREMSSSETVSYTAYDLLYYTLKNKATYNFKKKKPEDITTTVCKDMKIAVGSVSKTGKKYNILMKDKTIYEIIMAGYTKAKKSTGTEYHIITKQGKLYVTKMGDEWFSLELSESSNIISSTAKESLSEAVNKVNIYNDKGKLIKVVKNDESIVKYGIFQHTYTKEKDKDPANSAKAMLRGITRSMEIECIGYTGCITGKCVKIKDTTTGHSGKFYITADTHTWQNGIHTMKLSLSLTNNMDTVSSD
jgi:hypothetical protein